MALIVKPSGEAVVEKAQTTGAANAVTAANDSGSSEKVIASTSGVGTSAPSVTASKPTTTSDKVLEGMSFDDVTGKLNQVYDSKWDEQIADLYNQIVQRKSFSYNSEDDMLFQMYKQRYTDQGKQAMRDTIGQTSALTGGYGNSYGQAVGQQTYDEYLKGLFDLLPEFYDRAYQQYAAEGDRLTQLYSLTGDLDDRAHSRWQSNNQFYADAYDRLMNEAAVRGAAGDFGAYEDMFGADAAGKMEDIFNVQTLLPMVEAGLLDGEYLEQILSGYMEDLGITLPKTASSGSSGASASDIIRTQLYQGVASGTLTPEYAASVNTRF